MKNLFANALLKSAAKTDFAILIEDIKLNGSRYSRMDLDPKTPVSTRQLTKQYILLVPLLVNLIPYP